MTNETNNEFPEQILQLLLELERVSSAPQEPACDTPLQRIANEFFANNWNDCCGGLLQKTSMLRVEPEWSTSPRAFRFELDRPYKRKTGPKVPVELQSGPIRGMIRYRNDLFEYPEAPYIAVQIDPMLHFFHPNCSRRRGSLVCLGELPANLFPYPLDLLIETRLYPILTYQDRRPSDPFDAEAAAYFALHPEAIEGLEPVEPLY